MPAGKHTISKQVDASLKVILELEFGFGLGLVLGLGGNFPRGQLS